MVCIDFQTKYYDDCPLVSFRGIPNMFVIVDVVGFHILNFVRRRCRDDSDEVVQIVLEEVPLEPRLEDPVESFCKKVESKGRVGEAKGKAGLFVEETLPLKFQKPLDMRMFLKASLMSLFSMEQCCPAILTCKTSSMIVYSKDEYSSQMLALTDSSPGCDKLCMRRKPPSCFRTKPNGEEIKGKVIAKLGIDNFGGSVDRLLIFGNYY